MKDFEKPTIYKNVPTHTTDHTVVNSQKERLVIALRKYLNISEREASDDQLLEKTKGTLSRSIVDIQLAKEDFAKAVTPIVAKAGRDIREAFSKIRLKL